MTEIIYAGYKLLPEEALAKEVRKRYQLVGADRATRPRARAVSALARRRPGVGLVRRAATEVEVEEHSRQTPGGKRERRGASNERPT